MNQAVYEGSRKALPIEALLKNKAETVAEGLRLKVHMKIYEVVMWGRIFPAEYVVPALTGRKILRQKE